MPEKQNLVTQDVKIYSRNLIELSGINKIVSFNDEEFLLESSLGNIDIKGTGLEIIKLDTGDGNVKIKGTLNSLMYFDEKIKTKEESFISKLFK
jgi:sporulation protein YabP